MPSTTDRTGTPESRAAATAARRALADEGESVLMDELGPSQRRGARWARLKLWRGRALRVLVPLALIALWQASSAAGITTEQVLPSPGTVLHAFVESWRDHEFQRDLPVSLRRAGLGLAIGGSLGLVLGIVAGLWKIGEELFDAPLQMLRTIPFIALPPLFITWFGIDERPKIILISAATIFPMYLNTYHGVRGVDLKLIQAGESFGLTGWRLATRVVLRTALPNVLTGLRYACGVSILGLVVAEQINSDAGVGYLLINANQNQRPDLVIVGILIYAALGIVADVGMRLIERAALPWRPHVVRG